MNIHPDIHPEPLTTFVVHVLKQDIYELLHPHETSFFHLHRFLLHTPQHHEVKKTVDFATVSIHLVGSVGQSVTIVLVKL